MRHTSREPCRVSVYGTQTQYCSFSVLITGLQTLYSTVRCARFGHGYRVVELNRMGLGDFFGHHAGSLAGFGFVLHAIDRSGARFRNQDGVLVLDHLVSGTIL